jgi:hypothetical protein
VVGKRAGKCNGDMATYVKLGKMLNAILMSMSSCLGLDCLFGRRRLYRWITVLSQRKKSQLLVALYLAANSNYEDILPHIQYCANAIIEIQLLRLMCAKIYHTHLAWDLDLLKTTEKIVNLARSLRVPLSPPPDFSGL